MVQVRQPFERPRLTPPVLHVLQALEKFVTHALIGGERRPYEGEARLSIRVLDARQLLIEDFVPRSYFSDGELQRQRNVIGLREHETRHIVRLPPDTFEPVERRFRDGRVPERVEPRRLETRGGGAIETLSQHPLDLRRDRAAFGRRKKLPISLLQVSEDPLDV